MAAKTGALTAQDLLQVWRGAMDASYTAPFEKAGDGGGMEAWGQAFEQLARVSEAINATTQAMYIFPHSSQTGEPAAGERKATVTLTFRRSKLLERPMVLRAGDIFCEEVAFDWGDPEGVLVLTGRRYTLLEDLVFHPGEAGPFDAPCEAENAGYGYNNPLPGAIAAVSQAADDFNNDLATVAVEDPTLVPVGSNATAIVTAATDPDMFVPEHVGQYIYFTDGLNLGLSGRVEAFYPPVPGVSGSAVEIALEQAIQATTYAGDFEAGEEATFSVSGAVVKILGQRETSGVKRVAYLVIRGDIGLLAAGQVLTGATSGATATAAALSYPAFPVDEAPLAGTGGASWRVLSWAGDWGLEVANAEQPAGGRHGWLDALGEERAIYRAGGEDDETYRPRVGVIADVVTPNAIRRTLSRVMGSYPWCFREVGAEELRGFFYDGDGAGPGLDNNASTTAAALYDAYDTDVYIFHGSKVVDFNSTPGDTEPVVLETATNDVAMEGYFGKFEIGFVDHLFYLIRTNGRLPPDLTGYQIRGTDSGGLFTVTSGAKSATNDERRNRVLINFRDFRAYFRVGVPRLGTGEFGFAYDEATSGSENAWDWGFFDGYAVGAATFYRAIYQAIDPIRAGGVGWDLYIEDVGCP